MNPIIDTQNGISIVRTEESTMLRHKSCDQIAFDIYYNGLEITDRTERKEITTVCPQVAETYRKIATVQFAYLKEAIEDAERAHYAIQDDDPGCSRYDEDSELFDYCTANYRHRLAQSNERLEQAEERLRQTRNANREHSKVVQADQGGWWSAVYGIWDEIGGPEEGGWFYECGRLEQKRWHATREAAKRWVELLQKRVDAEEHYETGFRITVNEPVDYYPEVTPRYS